jgi:hypothetical protein
MISSTSYLQLRSGIGHRACPRKIRDGSASRYLHQQCHGCDRCNENGFTWQRAMAMPTEQAHKELAAGWKMKPICP